jgi:germination protein M
MAGPALAGARRSVAGDVMRRLPLVALAASLSALAACGGSGANGGSTTSPGTPSTAAGTTMSAVPVQSMDVGVYLMRGEKLGAATRTVPRTTAPAAVAMRELLAGPTARERAAGLGTAIPSGTRLRGLTIAGGVATVDLSARYASGGGSLSMSARLGQVVYTLTRFPSVGSVRFRLDGAPVTTFSSEGIVLHGPQTRADFEDVTPAILVERPAVGQISPLPLRVLGTADVFEAVVSYEVLDAAGGVLARGTTMASCGTGCRGRFQQTIAIRPPASRGTLVVYEVSAKDGSRINEVRIPLRFARARP